VRDPRTVVRMPLSQRVQHIVLIVTFSILVVTGLPMLVNPSPHLKALLSPGEIFQWRGVIHRIAGVGLIGLCFFHLAYIILSERGNRDFKSLLPGMKDAKDAVGTLAWQLRLPARLRRSTRGRVVQRRLRAWLPSTHPRYGHYTFIEKFEYLAVVWGSLLMVATGLLLWFEEATMALFPRYVFDLVTVVHSYEAVLAFLAILIWHMYQVHMRPGAFPMNRTWLDGKISLDELKQEHPLEYEALLTEPGASLKELPPGGPQARGVEAQASPKGPLLPAR
jgi:cytochrome b subunit of formate dehydrogenase